MHKRKLWRSMIGGGQHSLLLPALLILCVLGLVGCGTTDTTSDNASTLTPLPTPTAGPSQPATLKVIHMVDAKTGWALTQDGHVLHTTNGTDQWRDSSPTVREPVPVFGVATFLDAENAWIAGRVNDKVSIWRTYTGGEVWLESPLPINGQDVVNINFIDPQNGWLLLKATNSTDTNNPVMVFSTLDGGQDWNQINNADQQDKTSANMLPTSGDKTGLSFNNSNQGWITGTTPGSKAPLFYQSKDGGNTWNSQALTAPNDSTIRTFPPIFFNQKDGVMAAELTDNSHAAIIYTTHDGGTSWSNNGSTSSITSVVSFINANQGWATGSDNKGGTIYSTRDSGKTWDRLSQLGSNVVNITTLQFISATNGWAIGNTKADTTQLYQTTDGGKSWSPITTTSHS
ncbi:hypothetical protein KDA_23990 [Dictyobacter alpinus]|uniref:Sortilin N-terminal domain-containing protein n=1 Tax=Dictyobacter alpinus TaxID=2014873 RepID=A0A402B6E7_9CHLR|nr:YCF48-related protein [Dictyobacter alpinus]GCE26915.1 hypothetical protein KDA_23990 [Dictyobacter alpinus]